MRRGAIGFVWALCVAGSVLGHDIPNARVDRSIQVDVEPGRLRIAYEVSLAELTLTQDLRQLTGERTPADRRELFEQYAKVVGPLNAKGMLVRRYGEELELALDGYDLVVEDHPRFTFRYSVALPESGRVVVQDTNYEQSEGTSRLAVRAGAGISLDADALPGDVQKIPPRPVWQLTPAEERRTKRVEFGYLPEQVATVEVAEGPSPEEPPTRPTVEPNRLTALLDDLSRTTRLGLWLAALLLGVVHTIQPGHGKTLVAAATLGGDRAPWRGILLGLVTATTHATVVMLVAVGLAWSASHDYARIQGGLTTSAGFVIAAIGFYKLGRALGGHPEHSHDLNGGHRGSIRNLVALGVAGGLVPCWDAIALIVLAGAIGRMMLGVELLIAFSMGMATVLVLVGWAAGRFAGSRIASAWMRRLRALSALVISGIGLYLLLVA